MSCKFETPEPSTSTKDKKKPRKIKPSKNESGSKRSAPKQKMNKTVKVPGTQKSKTQLSATKMLRRKKVKHLEKLVKYYINRLSFDSALFWAQRLLSIDKSAESIYLLGRCLFLKKQYRRAINVIREAGLDKKEINPLCFYLVCKCLYMVGDYPEALDLLSGEPQNVHLTDAPFSCTSRRKSKWMKKYGQKKNIEPSLTVLKAQIHEKMENRIVAAENYKKALEQDIFCYEAFSALVSHHMISSQEEKAIIKKMDEQLANKPINHEKALVREIYQNIIDKYRAPSNNRKEIDAKICPTSHSSKAYPSTNLCKHPYVAIAEAERLYNACYFADCLSVTEEILENSPMHPTCLPIHIACLFQLRLCNKLFQLGEALIKEPKNSNAWYAVGCYYLVSGKVELSRKYFAKATSVDKMNAPAWIAYGHSFGFFTEHDQAMAAYFKSAQLLIGCHLPLLYLGMECTETNNFKLAGNYLGQACQIVPNDPFVIHEMGIVAYQSKEYAQAEKHFDLALALVHERNPVIVAETWGVLLNNLGHTHRKLKNYDRALEYHLKAVKIKPTCPKIRTAVGFVEALLGRYEDAAKSFHRALSIQSDNSFATSMLNICLERLSHEDHIYHEFKNDDFVFIRPSTSHGPAESSKSGLFWSGSPGDLSEDESLIYQLEEGSSGSDSENGFNIGSASEEGSGCSDVEMQDENVS
ncbi:unnamed protein product [Bemisia tabaci]|uniref:Cell division cycle protein 16 n=2 Tax=Bemisia tabaci TaxID=7038 RepID=A0A9N9ZZ27_BEMTA|nr:unnamed protein product [Bemisia tabaci]